LSDLFDQPRGIILTQGLPQQFFGIFQSAFADVGIGQCQGVKLVEYIGSLGIGDFANLCNFPRDFFNRIGGETLENFRGLFLFQGKQKNRRFPNSCSICHKINSQLPMPAPQFFIGSASA
jgi:hypothetical protein